MNDQLWDALDKIRGTRELLGPEELAELIREEGIQFSPADLISSGQFLAAQFGRHAGVIHVPEWLATVFRTLIEGSSPKTMCDPWAGIGLLIGALRAAQPRETFAFTKNHSEYVLGKTLVPEADWQLGNALDLLASANKEFDVVASILPIGARSTRALTIPTSSGKDLELRGELGHLLMVAASMKLSPSGIGLFVVTPAFFFSQRSVFRNFEMLGLGIEAALALPSGTFAPYANISAYLVVVRRKVATRMFVGQLSSDMKTTLQVIDNFRHSKEGGTLELGRFVDPHSFTGLEAIRTAERFALAERRFAAPSVTLGELATAINLGRFGEAFAFPSEDNAIFIPLIGNSDVVDSVDDLTLKKQNYAQVVVNHARSNARFVARFLNSEFGKEIREQTKSGFIPKLNKQTLGTLRVFIPDFQTQRTMLEIEGRIAGEQNTLLGLQSELGDFRRELWANPGSAQDVNRRLSGFSIRLAGGIKEHTVKSFDQWFETLPFPLASILRAWQATPSQDFKTKHEHLLHFFEGTAEFLSVILLSAFSSNEALFGLHKQKLKEAMQKQNLSFQRATFGTWKLVVEYLGKQTRELLSENGKQPDDAKNDRSLCADIFSDPSLGLPEALSRKELASILSTTNKMRNDWSGHGGVVGQEEAQLRNEQIISEVQKLRDVMAGTWAETQLVRGLHCLLRRGLFENEVAILMGSNSEFVKETRSMATCLDVERLYLSNMESGRALKLLPLVQVGSSPPSAKNACYFFNRMERDGARFISYHFTDQPELRGQFDDATETIKFLTEV